MAGGDGLAAAQALRTALPSCRIVILTTFGRSGYLRRAMDSGAVGFLLKDAPASELASALRRGVDGERVGESPPGLSCLPEGKIPWRLAWPRRLRPALLWSGVSRVALRP